METIVRTFVSECLFDDPVIREGWVIWGAIDSMVENYSSDFQNGLGCNLNISIAQYALYHRVAHILPKVLSEKVRSMEAMGELVIWYLILFEMVGINNVEKAKELARNGMRYFRNSDDSVARGMGEKLFDRLIKDMVKVPSRCAAIRLLGQDTGGSISNLSSTDLLKLSVEIEKRLINAFNNLSKHATHRPQAFGDPQKWEKLSPAMQGLA